MNANRLEAFSDGVLAIIITIMVLELKVPEGNGLESLQPLIPTFTTYVLSFVYLGIYWNNHHIVDPKRFFVPHNPLYNGSVTGKSNLRNSGRSVSGLTLV